MFLTNVSHIKWWMTGLNSRDTIKVSLHDQEMEECLMGQVSPAIQP